MSHKHAFALFVAFAALLGGCGGGGGTGGITPTAAPSATPTPQTPVWATPGTFRVQRITNLQQTTALPNGGGFSGSLATQAALLNYTQSTIQLTNVAPGVAPLVAARRPQDVLPDQTLAYISLNSTLAVPAAPLTITLQIPQPAVVQGASYYLAFYDPQRPSLGWQHGFAGPASVSTASGVPTLTFTGNAPQLDRYVDYWMAVYMLPSGVPAPTAAPSIAPSVTPAPTPVTFTELQTKLSMANSCSGTPCATGDITPTQGPQIYSVATAVPSPSHDGDNLTTALILNPQPNLPGDVLYYTPSLGEYPMASNFVWDFYVYIDQDIYDHVQSKPLEMQALEFDFNDASPGEPGFDFNLSSQCYLQDAANGYPQWQIWVERSVNPDGSPKLGWGNSGIPCYPWLYFTPNAWHHIQWTYRLHWDTLQTQYVDLQIDGVDYGAPTTTPLNPVVQTKTQAKATVEVQWQQDARGTPLPAPFKEWIDDATLTFW